MTLSGIYAIIHQPTGRAYIGSSHDVFRRWWQHARQLNAGTHRTPALLELWLQDGAGAFLFAVLEQCQCEALATREQAWLDSFENVLNGSRHAFGPSLDPVVAKKISTIRKRQGIAPTTRAASAAALRGRPMPQAQRSKISAALRGVKKSPAHREKIRLRLQEPAVRRKLSLANKGKGHDAAWRAKVSAAKMGHAVSADTRAKLRAASQAYWATPGIREAASVARCVPWTAEARARRSEMTRAWLAQMTPQQRSARARHQSLVGRVRSTAAS